jgi:hypothetical protein
MSAEASRIARGVSKASRFTRGKPLALRFYWKSQLEDGSFTEKAKRGRFTYEEGKAGTLYLGRRQSGTLLLTKRVKRGRFTYEEG